MGDVDAVAAWREASVWVGKIWDGRSFGFVCVKGPTPFIGNGALGIGAAVPSNS